MQNQSNSKATNLIEAENSVTDAASYLNLIGYRCLRKIGNMMVVYRNEVKDTGIGLRLNLSYMGLVDLRDMSVLMDTTYLLPSELSNLNGDLFKALERRKFIALVKFVQDPSHGSVDQYMYIVDCENGSIVMNGRRRGQITVCGDYIVTAKELRDKSKYRLSFVDMKTRKEWDVRIDTPTVYKIFNSGKNVDAEYTDGLCRHYLKIDLANVTGLTPTYQVLNHWGTRHVYLTREGLKFDTDIMTDSLDAIPIRFQLKTPKNVAHTVDERLVVNKVSYSKLITNYFWAYKNLNDWIFTDTCGRVIGRYKYERMSNANAQTIEACKFLCDAIDKIESGTLEVEHTGGKDFESRDVYVYNCNDKLMFNNFGSTVNEYSAI